jgi:hypothetical protein
MDDGVMTRKEGDGRVQIIPFHRGDVRWRPASGAYVAENTSDHPIRILEIDLKSKPTGVSTATKLDPTVVDPKHYKVMFENEYVRAFRVHFDPHDRSERHEHILNRVVWYMNDQAGAKADDVRVSGPGVHTEQNDGDTPVERLAVELK